VTDAEVNLSGSLKGYRLIVGFPGIGLIGPIAARHIIEARKMKLVGSIESPAFPAVAPIRAGAAMPPVRIYADRDSKTAVVVSEILFSEKTARAVGAALMEMAEREGVKMILSIAGVIMPAGQKGQYTQIFGAVSDPRDVEYLENHGISPIKQGITTGISAILLREGQRRGIPVMLILGTLHSKEDYRAAADVIRKIDELLGIDVTVEDLLERAERIEHEVATIAASTRVGSADNMYG